MEYSELLKMENIFLSPCGQSPVEYDMAHDIAVKVRSGLLDEGYARTIVSGPYLNTTGYNYSERAYILFINVNLGTSLFSEGIETSFQSNQPVDSLRMVDIIAHHISDSTSLIYRGSRYRTLAIPGCCNNRQNIAGGIYINIASENIPGNKNLLMTLNSTIAAAIVKGFQNLFSFVQNDTYEGRKPQHIHQSHERHFDIWHEVPLIAQETGMNCWAAAAAMIVGWRDQINCETNNIVEKMLNKQANNIGLFPQDVQTLAQVWGLLIEPPQTYIVDSLKELLLAHGPLWFGQANPGLHVIVITGMYGNGTPDKTYVRINDPWPIGRGERYSITFSELMQRFTAATNMVGIHAQVLHSDNRQNGGPGSYQFEEKMHYLVRE